MPKITRQLEGESWPKGVIRNNGIRDPGAPGSRTGAFGAAKTWLEGDSLMAAMKPRTGDGPMEVTKEGRSYVMRVPLEGGGRLVVELKADEAKELGEKLLAVFA